MSALASRLTVEMAARKEDRELAKGKILRKLTSQHPAGMSAYSLWVEVFKRDGDVSRVVSLLEELLDAGMVSNRDGCWYAGTTVPAAPALSSPTAITATRPAPVLHDSAALPPAPLPPRTPLPPAVAMEEGSLRSSVRAAIAAGHSKAALARRAVELGRYPSTASSTIAALLSAIAGGRTSGESSVYKRGIELALDELLEPAPESPGEPSEASEPDPGAGGEVTQALTPGGVGAQPASGEDAGDESLVGDSASPPDPTGDRQSEPGEVSTPADTPPHCSPSPEPAAAEVGPPAVSREVVGEVPEGGESVGEPVDEATGEVLRGSAVTEAEESEPTQPPRLGFAPLIEALLDTQNTIDMARAVLAELEADRLITEAFEEVAALVHRPGYSYPSQVVRDVRSLVERLVELQEEQDATSAELAALREGLASLAARAGRSP